MSFVTVSWGNEKTSCSESEENCNCEKERRSNITDLLEFKTNASEACDFYKAKRAEKELFTLYAGSSTP